MFRHVTTRVAGLIILIGGIWGGLIPFVGPYFHFTLGPDQTWTWTNGRFWLDVLPAIVAIVGGLLLLGAGPWAAGRVGALLGLVAGIWFVVGPDLSLLWKTGGELGAGHGSRTVQMLERLSFHTGLGVLIAAFAAFALPGLVGYRTRRATAPAEAEEAPTTAAPTEVSPAEAAPEPAGRTAGAADRPPERGSA